MVSKVETPILCSLSSAGEINSVVFSMDPSSVPRPHGFLIHFISLVRILLIWMLLLLFKTFFKRGWLYPHGNCNFVILIPKVEGFATITQYLSITLEKFPLKNKKSICYS